MEKILCDKCKEEIEDDDVMLVEVKSDDEVKGATKLCRECLLKLIDSL